MAIVKEFKEFALRGNVVDMAVGIIIGAAFSTIVKSLVDDVIMPPIGVVTGGVDFSDLFIALDGESYQSLAVAREAGAPTINYGLFINSVISFAIVAFVLFLLIKGMNHLRRKQEDESNQDVPAPKDIQLLEEIRDALVEANQRK
ncbi:Large-conductance mechanosensitive channel [Methyloligella halotolerans]|uniref:Large-conductance mechanosensitive channel n=1 Tax=Methyloligella halotolerans TaxID=1177755 RepID=A0A1E2RXW5_9HYPH|nr:Large-conductance mechanosensitive channel [Methyloligella halotolerans]